MTDEEKVKAFSDMIDVTLENRLMNEHEAKETLAEDTTFYAISGDIHQSEDKTVSICTELNFYSEEGFLRCRKETMDRHSIFYDETQWTFEEEHPLACMQTVPYYLNKKVELEDFYITEDMEGFDKVVEKLITTARVILL